MAYKGFWLLGATLGVVLTCITIYWWISDISAAIGGVEITDSITVGEDWFANILMLIVTFGYWWVFKYVMKRLG